jgi:hypothetical protein
VVARGVAATVGAVALGLLGHDPGAPRPATVVAQSVPTGAPPVTRMPSISDLLPVPAKTRVASVAGSGEPQSYVTPLPVPGGVPQRPASEFANYVVAHAEYSSPITRRAVLSGLVGDATTTEPQLVVPVDPRLEALFATPRSPQSGAMPPTGNAGR